MTKFRLTQQQQNSNKDQTLDFLVAIFGRTNGFLEIRAFPSSKNKPIQQFFPIPSGLGEAAVLATSLEEQIYYGAAPRNQQCGKANAVNIMPDLWVDGDDGALSWANPALTPSIVVNTGNVAGDHYQAYYLLDPPLDLKSESDRDKAVAYLKALAVALKGDSKSCDIARILRAPGTYNTKDTSHPGLCHIIKFDPEVCYSLEQVRNAITLSLVMRYWKRGQRQDLALSLAGYLAKRGTAQDKAEDLLLLLLQMTSDEEPQMRLRALAASYKKLIKGQPVKGYTGVRQYLQTDEIAALDSLWGEAREQPNRYLYHDKSGWHFDISRMVDDLLAEYSFKTLRDNEGCYVYEDGGYILLGEAVIKEECEKRVSTKHMSQYYINEVIGHIKRRTYVNRAEFNGEKWVLNLKNGLYDIQSGKLTPHTPEFLSTIRIPVEHNPEADCPQIKQFLREVLSPEDIPAVQEFFGYCLIPDYSIQKAFLFVGDGANGKSTLLNLQKEFIGKDNCSGVPWHALELDRFAKAALEGKLVNIFADIPSQSLRRTGSFKMLTGGDTIGAEKKFKSYFTFINYARLVFSANKPPGIFDEDSYAFWRRWIIINFPNEFTGEKADKQLLTKLTTQEELSGLLNFALDGLKRLLQQQEFSYTKSVEETTEIYLRAADPVYAFLKDMYESDPEGWISKDGLYESFKKYCQGNSIPVKKPNSFNRALQNQIHIRVKSTRTRIGDSRVRGWQGIKYSEDSGR